MLGGGSSNAGTVFSIKTDGSLFQVVHAFAGMSGEGKSPYGSALVSGRSGFLYGTTISGGFEDEGTVFRIRSDGTGFQVLHAFGGDASDGFAPRASLILDGAGNLYGTTSQGRASDGGTVFKVRTDGTEFKVLHTFLGGVGDGFASAAALILDGAGNLYGTTAQGGANGAGTVFRMKPDGTGFQLLHTFAPRIDGGGLEQPLVLDGSGNLYGTAPLGGSSDRGTVFKVRTDGTAFEVLRSFSGGAEDGSAPSGSLNMDAFGNLYGTSTRGGASDAGTVFKITVFKLNPQGISFQLLHSFDFGSTDGAFPGAPVILDRFGNLYGTTVSGGPSNAGTVFTVRTDGTGFRTLYAFGGVASDGRTPLGPLLLDGFGNLYGTTAYGGEIDFGTIFALWIGRSRTPIPGPFEPVRRR
jgi:uncharacterized repeat protein (TIGR03803 family)